MLGVISRLEVEIREDNIMGDVDQIIKKLIVPRLADMAFSASYKELLSNLLLCPNHHPEEKEKKLDVIAHSSLRSNKSQFLNSSKNVISFARSRLEPFPAGMNSKMR